jgi:DNA (cytosine-5)-methyltransferase 1
MGKTRTSRATQPDLDAPAPVKAIDFFCGAGGLTRGLIDAGVDVRAGVDVDGRLRRTYELNNEPSVFVEADINDVDIRALRKQVGICRGDIVLYTACTPCQPFSTLNQRKGVDSRKSLLLAFADLMRAAPPDFVVVENVPGLGNAYGKAIFDDFLETLDELGFDPPDHGKLDAKDYGVPQTRKRYLLVASRHGRVSLPEPNPDAARTVRMAIGEFPEPRIGLVGVKSRSKPSAEATSDESLPNHIARELSEAHRRIVKQVPKNGGSRSDIEDDSVLLDCHRRNPKLHRDVFGRMPWNGPAPTLTCRCTDVYCGRFVHPERDRGLSLREAAALQSFPDYYEFYGTFFHASQQIGNAVPVELARRLAKVITAAAASV